MARRRSEIDREIVHAIKSALFKATLEQREAKSMIFFHPIHASSSFHVFSAAYQVLGYNADLLSSCYQVLVGRIEHKEQLECFSANEALARYKTLDPFRKLERTHSD